MEWNTINNLCITNLTYELCFEAILGIKYLYTKKFNTTHLNRNEHNFPILPQT